jgi:hypothetical protein
MKIDWLTKLLLLLIALGLWANFLSQPRGVRASSECSEAESAARNAKSAVDDVKREIEKLRCGVTDFYGNITVKSPQLGGRPCLTLPDLQSNLESKMRSLDIDLTGIKSKIDWMSIK